MRPFSALSARQVRQAVVIGLTVGVVGVSYGAIAQATGFAWWQTLLMACLVFGGASELTFVGVIAAGGAPLGAALGAVLVNARNLAFGLSVGGALRTGPDSWFGAHFVHDEPAAFAQAAALGAAHPQTARRQAFWLLGIVDLVAWVITAMLGQWLGTVIDSAALGLDTAFPVIMACLVLGALREVPTLVAAVLGMAIAFALTPVLPAGMGPIGALLALAPVAAVMAARGGRRAQPTPEGTGTREGAASAASKADWTCSDGGAAAADAGATADRVEGEEP